MAFGSFWSGLKLVKLDARWSFMSAARTCARGEMLMRVAL